ncbi:MAG: BON domain-containing protein [Planctomycetia bacterium]|nr:BON domain-containing protein [Planctomycetia bacterium]
MTVRELAWSSMLALAVLGSQIAAAEPGLLSQRLPPIPSIDQLLADSIAKHVRSSALLRDYRVDIVAAQGKIVLTGYVVSQSQHDELIRLVQGVPGVVNVVDSLTIKEAAIVTVQSPPAPVAPKIEGESLPAKVAAPPAGGPTIPEPEALFRAQAPAYAGLNPPLMPPYAWPTYAPYNNFSRVAYPTAYPYHSWPFIGPVYPYPKVPLGWRSVKLEWDDGHWWFSRVGHPHNWWKLRYW